MKFRKKPVVIEAQRWGGDNARELMAWAHQGLDPMSNSVILFDGLTLTIRTLEGLMRADVGDMVIRGVKGEFYPCKPDIFALTYEPADALPPSSPVADFPTCPKCAAELLPMFNDGDDTVLVCSGCERSFDPQGLTEITEASAPSASAAANKDKD